MENIESRIREQQVMEARSLEAVYGSDFAAIGNWGMDTTVPIGFTIRLDHHFSVSLFFPSDYPEHGRPDVELKWSGDGDIPTLRARLHDHVCSRPFGDELGMDVVCWCQDRVAEGISEPLEAISVDVEVLTLAGDVLCMQMSPQTKVEEVKMGISDHWALKAGCQALLFGDREVANHQPIVDLLDALRLFKEGANSAKISFTLVVSNLALLVSGLADRRLEDRQKALRAISCWIPRDEHGIAAVLPFLKHGRLDVRRSALEALSIWTAGTQVDVNSLSLAPAIVTTILPLFEHTCSDIRKSAREAVSIMTGRNVRTVIPLLDHHNARVRRAALRILSVIARHGDELVISSLLKALQTQSNAQVETAECAHVLKVLGDIALEGDEIAISATLAFVRQHLIGPELIVLEVRCAGLGILTQLCKTNDVRVAVAFGQVLASIGEAKFWEESNKLKVLRTLAPLAAVESCKSKVMEAIDSLQLKSEDVRKVLAVVVARKNCK